MRRIFQNHVATEFGFPYLAMAIVFVDHACAPVRTECAYENARALQIGRDVDGVDADQRAIEVDFTRNDTTELTFHEFVYSELSMFHFLYGVSAKCRRPRRWTPYNFWAICSS